MPFVETRLISPTTLTTSASSALYTVPTGYSAIIKQLVVTNITGTAASFTFYIGSASAGNALFSGTSVAANDTVIINLSQVLTTGETLRALASTGSALNLTVSGVLNDGPLASTATYIADNAITVNKIADGSVTTAKIAAGAVDTVDIANNAVTQAKLASTLSATTVTTSALRSTAVPSPFAGQTVFETDTNKMLVWNGTAWVVPNSPAQNPTGLELVTPSSAINGTVSATGAITFSAANPVSINGCFSALYQNYKIEILITTSNQVVLQYRFRTAGTDNQTANYANQTLVADSTTVVAARTTSQTIGDLGQMVLSDLSFFDITLYNPFATAKTGMLAQNGSFVGNAFIRNQVNTMGASTSFDGISFIPTAGTITGTARVYGYRD